jgi:D-beta-D-heptose 7-phosphate kinase/D-beta-D-heptose 1-phosphate adenosyltransferase
MTTGSRPTSVKTRVVAHQQQVVRIDRESRDGLDGPNTRRLLRRIRSELSKTDAIIVGDYGKGVVTQPLLDGLRQMCRERGVWLSLDPKPIHSLNLSKLSLITPNRKECFELAGVPDETREEYPIRDKNLMRAVERLLGNLEPAILLITLGELGMLLCRRDARPVHIPTIAQEVFDVSGAGDTVISAFTTAVVAGASPIEAALISNHAAGIVVGKMGTATVTPEELAQSFP